MKTMLDKVAVAGDITQALDRRGVATVAITVIGGTESTAVKLQSCETADGSFTDFAELISASDATADQYKGFVVDLNGAGKFIKVVGATMATAVFGDCDYDVKQVAIKAGEIPSGADLEDNKTATIDVSTYTEPVEITPTAGKDGMKKATVTLENIPSGGDIEANKEVSITENGTVEITPTEGKDGMAKVTATVDVPKTLWKFSYTLDATAVDSILFKEEPQVGVPITGYFSVRTSYAGDDCTELLSDSFTFSNLDRTPYVLSSKPTQYPYSRLYFKETI